MTIIKSMYPPLPELPPKNVVELLFNRQDQKEWKDHTLHIDANTGRKRTFRQFIGHVYDGCAALGSPETEGGLGLTGDRFEMIGVLGPNSSELAALITTAVAITTPFVVLSSYYTQHELSYALKTAQVTRLFVHPRWLGLARKASRGILSEERLYLIEGQSAGKKNFTDLIHVARKRGLRTSNIRPAGRDTLAYLIFSSGTSGAPKAVMISHGNIVSSLWQGALYGEASAAVYVPEVPKTPEGIPVVAGVLPMHHTFGLQAFGFRVFLAPMTIVFIDQWHPQTFLKLITRYHITYMPFTPSMIHSLVNAPEFKKADFSTIQSVSSGAAYLPPQLAHQFYKTVGRSARVNMTEGYGMSESTLSITSKIVPGALGGRVKAADGTAGILMAGMEVRVVREDGTDAETNEAGELWVKGPVIALGYWNNEAATKETFVDGWLKTGDRFRIDTDGNFFFEDRIKDILKISGMQVSPVEIEDTLLSQPDGFILDAAVGGVSGGRTSDEKIPRAWVVLSEKGKTQDPVQVIKMLDAHCAKLLSKYKRLRGGIEIIDSIPKSPTGKVLRRILQDNYEKSKTLKSKL